jgi:hypothetical protein
MIKQHVLDKLNHLALYWLREGGSERREDLKEELGITGEYYKRINQ